MTTTESTNCFTAEAFAVVLAPVNEAPTSDPMGLHTPAAPEEEDREEVTEYAAYVTTDRGKVYRAAEHVDVAHVLPPGVYGYWVDQETGVPCFKRERLPRSKIILDEDQQRTLAAIATFWTAVAKYQSLGFSHKRGALLYGPAGTGKTTTLRALALDCVKRGGYVLKYIGRWSDFHACLSAIRDRAPDAPVMVAMEDIDQHVRSHEEQLLDMIDGSTDYTHVLWVATTNHREKCPARLLRPSRFDVQIEVGMPTAAVRENYIRGVLKTASGDLVADLVEKTTDMSIAQTKEEIIKRCVLA
jgi:hypothetical protein